MTSLLEKLQELYTNGPAPHSYGICTQLTGLTGPERVYLLHLMQQWPGSSGHIYFPVPASRTNTSPGAAQIKYSKSSTKQMWHCNTEHGQLRWELLEWLIEELQK